MKEFEPFLRVPKMMELCLKVGPRLFWTAYSPNFNTYLVMFKSDDYEFNFGLELENQSKMCFYLGQPNFASLSSISSSSFRKTMENPNNQTHKNSYKQRAVDPPCRNCITRRTRNATSSCNIMIREERNEKPDLYILRRITLHILHLPALAHHHPRLIL